MAINRPFLLKPYLVAYLDLLGLRSQMVAARSDRNASECLLRKYRRSLNKALRVLELRDKDCPWSYRIFTDSIVLATPCETFDAEAEVGMATIHISEFQLILALNGWLVRGGVSLGLLYIDDSVVFGPALVEAYDLESQQARDPRVILSPVVVDLVRRHLAYYANPYKSPQNGYIVTDTDGIAFINYLYAPLGLDDRQGSRKATETHKKQIVVGLRKTRNDPRIWAKYWWVASYHNFFCRKWFPAQPRIRVAKKILGSEPSLLVASPKPGRRTVD